MMCKEKQTYFVIELVRNNQRMIAENGFCKGKQLKHTYMIVIVNISFILTLKLIKDVTLILAAIKCVCF